MERKRKKNTNRALQAIEPIRNVSVNYDRLARIPRLVMICCAAQILLVPGPHSWKDSIYLVHGPIKAQTNQQEEVRRNSVTFLCC
jgi:hypothetical protein